MTLHSNNFSIGDLLNILTETIDNPNLTPSNKKKDNDSTNNQVNTTTTSCSTESRGKKNTKTKEKDMKNTNKRIEEAQEEAWKFAKFLYGFSKDKNRLYFGTEISPLDSPNSYKTVKKWVDDYKNDKNFNVGDEVLIIGEGEKFIITHIDSKEQVLQGFGRDGLIFSAPMSRCKKTNQTSPIILSILKSLQE